ncbi:MAG: hypothetical protein ACN4GZ_05190 [Acidimicrobiales bacterium]
MPLPLWQMLILAAVCSLWIAWLVVPFVRSLRTREHDSIGSFRQQLTAMGRAPEEVAYERASGGQLATSPAKWRAQSVHSRRRQIFLALCMSVVVSLVAAIIGGGIFVGLHLTMDVLLATFVAFANRAGAREVERRETVIYLDDYERDDEDSPFEYVEDDELLVNYG